MYHIIRAHERSAGKVLTLLFLFHLIVKGINATNVDRLCYVTTIDGDGSIFMNVCDSEWFFGRDTEFGLTSAFIGIQ